MTINFRKIGIHLKPSIRPSQPWRLSILSQSQQFHALVIAMDTTRLQQKLAETGAERESRKAEGFPNVESQLRRHTGTRLDIPFLDNLTSFLGKRNVLAREVDPATELVWLLDNTAYRPVHSGSANPGPWEAEFVAAYFAKHSGKDVSEWVADIADKIGLGGEGENRAEGEATIAKRLHPFVRTIRPARYVNVKFPSGQLQKLGPGGRNAISSEIVGIKGEHVGGSTWEVATIRPELAPHGPMLTHFAASDGWAVISGRFSLVTVEYQGANLEI
jgi:hypothetical protein